MLWLCKDRRTYLREEAAMDTAARKPLLRRVAETAGVSSATVDRVLNERGNVSPKTAQKVINAARQIGLKRILPGSYHKGVRIEVLLIRPELPLIKRINQYFINIASTLDRSVIVNRTILKNDDPKKFASHLLSCKAQGIILYGREDKEVHDAIAAVSAAGKLVVTVISDMHESARFAYAGADHYAGGRTAGFFMSRMARQPGSVVILCNHHKYHGHVGRIRGMQDALLEAGNGVAVSDVLEGRDEGQLSELLLTRALQGRSDVIGIYNAGAANLAVERAIKRSPLVGPIFIGHELTENTIRMLREGIMTLTIDQNPERQARNAVNLILGQFGYSEPAADPQTREYVPFTIYTRENLPTNREQAS
jgi:LacI family transcriptional regulator